MNAYPPEYELLVQQEFQDLLNSCPLCSTPGTRDLIKRAFELAEKEHRTTVRKSGEPYILHPIAVAKITAEIIPADPDAIAAALLHDVVEDCPVTVDDLKEKFNPEIANMVDGLTKIAKLDVESQSAQAANFQKLILTIKDDYRIIFIKLADRLHNMRTLISMPEKNQMKTASETTFFYAPIAERVGLYNVKTELEDLSLRIKDPNAYERIHNALAACAETLEESYREFAHPIEQSLQQIGLQYRLERRKKSVYSIWRKMERKKIPFEEVYDLLAMRIIFTPVDHIPEKVQCWFIYSLLSEVYTVQRERTRDWISAPKVNGYEALHCTLLSTNGTWVEVQIRTERMHCVAELGLASHWKYKGGESNIEADQTLNTLRGDIERQKASPDQPSIDFVNQIKSSIFQQQITLYDTEKNPYDIPRGATVLDFAYAVSSAVGNSAIGGIVNGEFYSLDRVLRGGEAVRIITAQTQNPSRKWLDYVKTPKAKNCIDQNLRDQQKIIITTGKRRVFDLMDEIHAALSEEQLLALLPDYELNSLEELYISVANGDINTRMLSYRLKRMYFHWPTKIRRRNLSKAPTTVNTLPTAAEPQSCSLVTYVQSSCCFALPGDEVIGYQSEDRTIIVHKKLCSEGERISAQEGNRIVAVDWRADEQKVYTAHLFIRGTERKALLADIFTLLSDKKSVNVTKVAMHSSLTDFKGVISMTVHDRQELETIERSLNSIPSVKRVYRMDSQANFSIE